jgi:hypothetical protein
MGTGTKRPVTRTDILQSMEIVRGQMSEGTEPSLAQALARRLGELQEQLDALDSGPGTSLADHVARTGVKPQRVSGRNWRSGAGKSGTRTRGSSNRGTALAKRASRARTRRRGLRYLLRRRVLLLPVWIWLALGAVSALMASVAL